MKLAHSLTFLFCILALAACAGQTASAPSPTSMPTATATPSAAATDTPRPTATLTPLPTSTATPTPSPAPTATSRPTATATPIVTATPASAPKPTLKPTAPPTSDPIANRKIYSNAQLGFSIAYPGDWLLGGKDTSATLGTLDLKDSNRARGAELIVVISPQADPETALQTWWDTKVPAMSPGVQFGQTVPITLGGEKALRALFSDSRDNSHGWFMLVKHKDYFYIVVAQAMPNDNWVNYEKTFRAMLATFRFLK